MSTGMHPLADEDWPVFDSMEAFQAWYLEQMRVRGGCSEADLQRQRERFKLDREIAQRNRLVSAGAASVH